MNYLLKKLLIILKVKRIKKQISMPVQKTQKDVLFTLSLKLDSLAESNKKIAKDQLQLSCDFSNYINKQDLKNAEILGYLESNNRTNQKGAIEQIKENKQEIDYLKTRNSIKNAERTLLVIIGGFLSTVIGYVVKLLF